MRAVGILALDVAGLALLVAAAWTTWGLGAGLATVGASCLAGALLLESPRRRREPK